MASEKQILANRENALAAGVKTEEGKKKIRFNSLRHGLCASALLTELSDLPESAELLTEIHEGLRQSLLPTDYLEEVLVHRAAVSIFKMFRCEAVESRAFRGTTDIDNPIFSVSFETSAEKEMCRIRDGYLFESSLKYRAAIDGQFYRAIQTLHQLRQSRRQLDLFEKEPPL